MITEKFRNAISHLGSLFDGSLPVQSQALPDNEVLFVPSQVLPDDEAISLTVISTSRKQGHNPYLPRQNPIISTSQLASREQKQPQGDG